MTEAVQISIDAYMRGRLTFNELRTAILDHATVQDCESIFGILPDDAATKLVQWLHEKERLSGPMRLSSFESSAYSGGSGIAVERLSSKLKATEDWTTPLDFAVAATNVATDAFGDWYRDPWGWPELNYLGGAGRIHVVSRALRGPVGASIALDVPKNPSQTRPATVLDLVDRVLYQGCVDSIAPKINAELRPWVFGWRLPQSRLTPGVYLHNNAQWLAYFGRLRKGAHTFDHGWRTDISDFFASVEPSAISSGLHGIAPPIMIEMIQRIIDASNTPISRKGLPQRSAASSVVANHLLNSVDKSLDAGADHAIFARWLDDLWLFASSRKELDLLSGLALEAIASLGFVSSSAKTAHYSGDELHSAIDRLDLAYVDDELEASQQHTKGLESAVGELIHDPAATSRHEISFVTARIKKYRFTHLAERFVSKIDTLAYAADLLAPMFLKCGQWRELSDWCPVLLRSNHLPWAKSTFLRMYPRNERLPRKLVQCFAEAASNRDLSILVRLTSLSRIAKVQPGIAGDIFGASISDDMDPLMRRALGFGALMAGVPAKSIRRFLLEDDATVPVLGFLDSIRFDRERLAIKA